MATKKITKTRKVSRAKATKKTSVRTSRKAPGVAIKAPSVNPTPVATW
jgi:hypothetical protein